MPDKRSKFDQETIRQLAALLNETGLSEIEIENNDSRIRVARTVSVASVAVPMQPAQASPQASAPAPPAASEAAHAGTVHSPMVGTAYLSPAPGEKPYVDIGSEVRQGDTLLIIEAMKTMNQIPAPRSGKVIKILVEDAQPVEYGESLLIIE